MTGPASPPCVVFRIPITDPVPATLTQSWIDEQVYKARKPVFRGGFEVIGVTIEGTS